MGCIFILSGRGMKIFTLASCTFVFILPHHSKNPSATLIVTVIICIKSLFSLLTFKPNIFSPQSVVLLVITFIL